MKSPCNGRWRAFPSHESDGYNSTTEFVDQYNAMIVAMRQLARCQSGATVAQELRRFWAIQQHVHRGWINGFSATFARDFCVFISREPQNYDSRSSADLRIVLLVFLAAESLKNTIPALSAVL